MYLLANIENIIPTRNFNMTYIIFDTLFLVFLVVLLCIKKKYLTLSWALFGGVLYLFVDFGLFYLASHTREIYINGQLLDSTGHFLVLLWLSFSYGIPNFIFIWMALNKDKDFALFTTLILGWWLVVPTLSKFGEMSCFANSFLQYQIKTLRLTKDFHWIMAMFMIIGYGLLIGYYIINSDKRDFKKDIKTILFLNLIGFSTQMMWELPLLLNGIRPLNDTSIQTLLINSVIETNSGMVYFYLFHKWLTKKVRVNELLKIEKQAA